MFGCTNSATLLKSSLGLYSSGAFLWATTVCRRIPRWLIVTTVPAVLSFATPVGLNEAVSAKARQIRIEYGLPKNPEHQSIYEQLRQARALEYIQELLNSFRLPRPVTLKLTGCDGVANAFSSNDMIIVCYEFMAEILKNAPEKETPAGITRLDAVVGPALDVFLHEAGHLLFNLLRIPILGREEDAADQFSTYIMLQYDKSRARNLILGSAYQYRVDMQQGELTLALQKFSNEHGLPAQRFYNILCLAYGADAKLFADVVQRNYLPLNRAENCVDEYQQVSFAFKTLIGPHVDKRLAKRALKQPIRATSSNPSPAKPSP